MIDLDFDNCKEFHLKMLIAGLKDELEEALGTVEELQIQREIEKAKKELINLDNTKTVINKLSKSP